MGRPRLNQKPRRSRGRKANTREPIERIVLLSDGDREVSYLKQLVAHYSLMEKAIVLDEHTGIDAHSLVKVAKKIKLGKYKTQSIYTVISDDIWVVCDVEVPPETIQSRKIPDAVQMAEANGINIILSTPCVEIWFLLHYREGCGPMLNGAEAKRAIKNYMPRYEEGLDYSTDLNPRESDAIIRAKRMMQGQDRDNNPGTEIQDLVEYLLSL